jgi:hypothetical protein
MAEFQPLPPRPTNADLARGIAELHDCLDEHRRVTRDRDVVFSAQITGVNGQMTAFNAKLDPIADEFAKYQRLKRRIGWALGIAATALITTAATNVVNAVSLSHQSAAASAAADQGKVNQALLAGLQQMQAQSAASAAASAKQGELLDRLLQQSPAAPAPHHKGAAP